MRRKRKQRNLALMLPSARLEEVGKVVGYAKVWTRERACLINDNSVDEVVLESASALGLNLTDQEIESVANRLLGRERISEMSSCDFAWHLL